jgi:hypothetical protein
MLNLKSLDVEILRGKSYDVKRLGVGRYEIEILDIEH